MEKKRHPIWFYLVLIILPFLLILLLELGLQLFNYGKDLTQWVEVTKDKLILNPEISAKYFTNLSDYPASNGDSFDKNKKSNSFRVFILGGSTAAGFPYSPNGGFSKYLQNRLILNYPKNKIEVVNLGITAVNTYTILDLLPGVIEQKPDLVIIYSGHNEFYGALGVGSSQSIGKSPFVINTYLYLSNFKIFQLVKNITQSIVSIFQNTIPKTPNKTLMARMASEQIINMNSEIFNAGIDQFENNLSEIVSICKKENIPILLSTLVSNLKDQKPFINTTFEGHSADEYFLNGENELNKNNFDLSNVLFKKAKDLDGLRFRAPEEFNLIIKKISVTNNLSYCDVENEFSLESPNKIVGSNLIIDHLHPNLDGYFLMGKIFYGCVEKLNLLPQEDKNSINSISQESMIRSGFAFSKLDSIASEVRIFNLLNDWPFNLGHNKSNIESLRKKGEIEALGYSIVMDNLNWRIAHQEAYRWYYEQNDFANFSTEIFVLLSQYPYKIELYNFAAEQLLNKSQFEYAKIFLLKKRSLLPDSFSSKWLGNISLLEKNYNGAVNYLLESINLDPNDPQTYYNLSLTYSRMGKYKEALKSVNECLAISPNYSKAKKLYYQLIKKSI